MTESNGEQVVFGQQVEAEFTANEMKLIDNIVASLAGRNENKLEDVLINRFLGRIAWWDNELDPQRKIAAECGYGNGSAIPIQSYRQVYDRDCIAARVVEVMPLESWQVQPSIYEDEDSEIETAFEKAWRDVHKSLHNSYAPKGGRQNSYYQDEEGSLIWSYLLRLDIVSGIGHYGVLLLGINDGRDLREPVEGFETLDSQAYLGTEGQYGPNPYYPYTQGYDETTREQIRRAVDRKAAKEGYGRDDGTTPSQYQLTPGIMEPDPDGKRKLIYLRVFDESLAQITRYERDANNPRFGLPVMYLCIFNDPKNDPSSAAGLPVASAHVHWSRLIHFADKLGSNEVLAYPRLKQPWNRLIDLMKLYGAAGEGYWQQAFSIISGETNPQLGGDVTIDRKGIDQQMAKIREGLKRHLISAGMKWSTLAPQPSDPTAFKDTFIEAVCILGGYPVRVFKGSERGELASSQDDGKFNDRLKHRQNFLLTPRMIVPFVDRLIQMGVLPEPKGFSVKWPDLESDTDAEKATISLTRTQALQAYVSGNLEAVMTPMDYLTRIMQFAHDEAEAIVEAAQQSQDNEEAMTPGMQPEDEPLEEESQEEEE